ncbi:hypothetical protein OG352_00885 [Streptomyces sp. NBC_01485]|uniref:hypothetical protein n=1 Tax=Streptomyces sp. NBC_01485 TaxID=2903884 RepID=UPI002E373C3F|nr:hypothetical protein [Streptomyces sp. NBC_01485]
MERRKGVKKGVRRGAGHGTGTIGPPGRSPPPSSSYGRHARSSGEPTANGAKPRNGFG